MVSRQVLPRCKLQVVFYISGQYLESLLESLGNLVRACKSCLQGLSHQSLLGLSTLIHPVVDISFASCLCMQGPAYCSSWSQPIASYEPTDFWSANQHWLAVGAGKSGGSLPFEELIKTVLLEQCAYAILAGANAFSRIMGKFLDEMSLNYIIAA